MQQSVKNGRFDRGNRARIGYMADGRPLLAIMWEIAEAVKGYSLGFTLKGKLSIRAIFKDGSPADFTVENQEKLYESMIKHKGFTVVVSADVGEMDAYGREKQMKCIGEPYRIDFTPEQFETLKISYNTYKMHH